jgi:hypothetical protein
VDKEINICRYFWLVEKTGLQLIKILLFVKYVSRGCGGMGKQWVQVRRG